jgi:hypothetical protein
VRQMIADSAQYDTQHDLTELCILSCLVNAPNAFANLLVQDMNKLFFIYSILRLKKKNGNGLSGKVLTTTLI